ncbi:NAD(+)/NADH kinase [bacterium]|nr:NAD(+)/NADH kinase [bacterium]
MLERRIIGIYTQYCNAELEKVIDAAKRFFQEHDIETTSLENILQGQKAEAILSLGGDGCVLNSARSVAHKKIPVLGVNFGHIGYLCSAESNELLKALQALADRQYTIETRTMLHCDVYQGKGKVWESEALNEFLVGGSNRTVSLEITINDQKFANIRSDGILLSTSTGSTAHSFSAGGPILTTDNNFCLLAINPIFSIIKSLILDTTSVVSMRNLSNYAFPFVVADGQRDFQLKENMLAKLRQSDYKANLIQLGNRQPILHLHNSLQRLIARELNGQH